MGLFNKTMTLRFMPNTKDAPMARESAPPSQIMHARTNPIVLPPKELPKARQSDSPRHQDDASENPSEALADSVSSEKVEGQDSEYEASENEDADVELSPAQASVSKGQNSSSLPGMLSPDLDDEQIARAPESQPKVSKCAPRASIGLGELMKNKFPSAEMTILGDRSKTSAITNHAAKSTTAQVKPQTTTLTRPIDLSASPKSMPPPNRGSSKKRRTKDRQDSRSRQESGRFGSASPVRLQIAAAKLERPSHVAPVRVKPTDSSPPAPATPQVLERIFNPSTVPSQA